MSRREIFYRIYEQVKKWSGYRFSRGWNNISPHGTLNALPGFDREWPLSDQEKELIAIETRQVYAGQFNLLGASWASSQMPPDSLFWQRLPDNTLWSSRDSYCFSPLADRRCDRKEIKYLWELNRLQFLVPIAIDARLTNDGAKKKFVVNLILSWMEGNRPYRGANWLFGIELALRIVSVAAAISIMGIETLAEDEKCMLRRFFNAHAFWILRYPSLHSSQNNHRIAELVGLVVAATMVAGDNTVANLKSEALAGIFAELQTQILPDGIGAEQSLSYSAFSIELALMALIASQYTAKELPPLVCECLQRWMDYVHWITDEGGHIPVIGDCDECRALGFLSADGQNYVTSIASATGKYLGGDHGPSFVRALVFKSFPVVHLRATGMRTWPEGGYTVIRTQEVPAVLLVLDHGPLGYLSLAAHGHADTLAIWLSVGGRPIVVDAGTYVYNSDREWRERFRATRLHNTLAINESSSSTSSGPFNWSAKAVGRLVHATYHSGFEVVAEHDGYLNRFSVRHRRTVRVTNGSIYVIDELLGAALTDSVDVSFLIDPTYHAVISHEVPNTVMVRCKGHEILRFVGNGALSPNVFRGDEKNGFGWISSSFGKRLPTDQIVFRGVWTQSSVIQINVV